MAIDPIYFETGTLLRNLRLSQGRSMADVAAAADISVSTLAAVENATRQSTLGTCAEIARALHGTPHFIVDMEPPPVDDPGAGMGTISGGVIGDL